MTSSLFRNAVLSIAVLGCVGNTYASDPYSKTTASKGEIVLASAGVAAGAMAIPAICILTNPDAIGSFLMINSIALAAIGSGYLIKNARHIFGKQYAALGSLSTGVGAAIFGGILAESCQNCATIPWLLPAGALFAYLAALGYYLQPKNTEIKQA